MKYQVQISYTNPAHEHISLRRRVDTVTRIVEARTEQEALNRAANQQRALGFMIKEAKVSKGTAPTTPKEKKLAAHYGDPDKITKGDVVTARIKSGMKEEVEQMDEVKLNTAVRALGQMKKRADDYYSSPEDKKRVNRFQNTIARKFGEKGAAVADKASSNVGNVERHSNPGDALGRRDQPKITPDSVMQRGGRQGKLRPGVLKDIKRLQKAKLYSLTSKTKPNLPEEVEQMDELNKSTLASYVNKAAKQVRAKTGIAASFETKGEMKRDPENKAAYMNAAKDYRKGAKKRLTGIEKATAKLAKEEVEQIDEALTASDPASKWISDFVKSDNPKFAGKSKKERINMALGAYYAATRGNKKD